MLRRSVLCWGTLGPLTLLGGCATVRAKLGIEYESLIGTVRNVGYRFSPEGGPRSDE